MNRATALLAAALSAVVLLSGCGPASSPPATSASTAPTSPSSAGTTQTPTAPTTSTVASAPAATAPPSNAAQPAAEGTAVAAAMLLDVKGRAPKTGYTRAQFGQAWFDTDRNGCDTRNDILRRDLQEREMANACKVLAGTLAPDPFTGASIRFGEGSTQVDIDHVVALSDAWQKGAASWPGEKRLAFANDPLNLLAVDSSANRAKSDGDTATWLPPYKPFRCSYVARQVAVKGKYGLWVTSAERDAMTRVLATCPTMATPGPGSAPTVAVAPEAAGQPAPAPAPEPAPAQPEPTGSSVYYANCTAARAAGAAPIMRGEPGYASRLDRDGDGVACE